VEFCLLQVEAMLLAAGVAEPAKINMMDKFFPHADLVQESTLGGGLPGHSTDAHGSIKKYLHDPRSIATLVCIHYHTRVALCSVYFVMRVSHVVGTRLHIGPHFGWYHVGTLF
jgi:hypothetical protein